MKRLAFGNPLPGQDFGKWAEECFREIERASAEDIEAVVSEFSITGTLTEARTFNAGTASLAELRNVLATMVTDIKKRGQNRAYGT